MDLEPRTSNLPLLRCGLRAVWLCRSRLGGLLLLLYLSLMVLPLRSDAGDRACVNVDTQDRAYEALETLGAGRLLRYPSPGIRPLSRHEIAREIAGLSEDDTLAAPYRTALSDLRGTLSEFGNSPSTIVRLSAHDEVRHPKSEILLRFVPYLRVETAAIGVSRGFRKNVDPYSPYYFSRGVHLGLQLSLAGQFTRYAAIFLSPYIFAHEGGPTVGVDRMYLNLRWSGVTLEIGKDALWWGLGYHGNFVMTDNPPPLPMMKVGGSAGGFRGVLLLARGLPGPEGKDARLVGATVEWSYFRRLVIQASVGIAFGGRAHDLFKLITSPTEADVLGNQIAEIGLSVCPWEGVKLYAVTAGDDFYNVGWAMRLPPWGRGSADLVGVYLTDPLKNGKTTFRFELARLIEKGPKTPSEEGGGWYYHTGESHPYPYLYKGYLIGHPMARAWEGNGYRTNRRDLFLRASHRLSRDMALGIDVDLESADAGVPFPESEDIVHLDDKLTQLSLDLWWSPADRWSVRFLGRAFFEKRTVRSTGKSWSSTREVVTRFTVAYEMGQGSTRRDTEGF